ncbi:MAG: hypothetical protein KC492_27905 [Myxococcales bacterium]|nr:hypothetical protein [Myxococcales bacterium]
MVRSLALIVLAIQLSRPSIPRQEAVHYAKVLQQEAKEHDFDPFTGVAIIHFESYWHPGVVSKDGEDYGLAQIRARYVKGCRADEDPLDAPSAECQSAKARLLDGATNIRRMAALITANRELCKEKTGRVWFHEWLASYQGRNRPKQDKWCKPGEGTWRVVNYRKELIAKLAPQELKAKATAKAKQSKASRATKAEPGRKSEPGRTAQPGHKVKADAKPQPTAQHSASKAKSSARGSPVDKAAPVT